MANHPIFKIMKRNHFLLALIVSTFATVGCNGSETQPTTPPAPTMPAAKTELPPGHPPIDMSQQTLPPGTSADAANPQWTVPANWQPGKISSMRRASYVVKGDGDKAAEIVVTVFPGDVGGLVANVNRWRGQIGLAPVAAEEIAGLTTKVTVAGEAATQVDFKNVASGARMIVVTVPHAGNSWFYKLTGDAALVEAQKTDFIKFVQSVKY